MADRKLALQALALGLKIDGAGQAFYFSTAGIRAAQACDGFGQACALAQFLAVVVSRGLFIGGSGEKIGRFLGGQQRAGDRGGKFVRPIGDQGLGGRVDLGRSDRSAGKRSDHQKGGAKRHEH